MPASCKLLQDVDPEECYHLAAQSYVSYSFDDEFSTMRINVQGTYELLAAVKQIVPPASFISQALAKCSAKCGQVRKTKLPRFTDVRCTSISKVTGHQICQYYREAYNVFACTGILFDHESPRRV